MKFLKHVSDYQPELLPKPSHKIGIKTEQLHELPIILLNTFKIKRGGIYG